MNSSNLFTFGKREMNPELLTLVFIPRGACHLHDDEKTHFRGWLSDEFRSCSIFSNKRATCKWKLFTMAKRPVLWQRNFQRRIGRLKEAVASQKSHNSFNREICLFVVSSEPLMPECCNSDMYSLRSILMSSPSLKSVRVRLCVGGPFSCPNRVYGLQGARYRYPALDIPLLSFSLCPKSVPLPK